MTKSQRARLRAIILALTFALSSGVASAQAVPLVTFPFSMSGVGVGPSVPLSGQSSCAVVLSNAGTGLTLIPQASSDQGATWVTATTIGSGSIGSIGSYVGSIGGLGLTTFRFVVSALSSGTVSGQETCSGAIGPAAAGSGTTVVTQPTASQLNATVVFPSAQPVTGTFFQATQPVSCATAATCPTNATLQAGSTTAVTQPTAANLNATVVFASAQPVTGTFFQATQPVSCASGATCPNNATLQAGSANAGGFELFDSGGTNKASINLPGAQLTAQGKTRFILTSGSATTCTNLQATAGNLVELVNVGSATTVFPAWYDDAGATCATGARVYGNFTSLTLQAGQAIQLNVPLTAGLAYKLSGALSDNLVVVTQ